MSEDAVTGGTVVTIALSAIFVVVGVVAAIISEAHMPGSPAAASGSTELAPAMHPPPASGPSWTRAPNGAEYAEPPPAGAMHGRATEAAASLSTAAVQS
jgi:hypothetical protein